MFDSFNRKIDYLRISVTDRCNLRCTYCMPAAGIQLKRHADILPYERIVEVAAAAADLGIRKVRLTGGEPLVRRNIAFLVRELKALPGLSEVSMTSNGVLLDLLAGELKQAGLDRLNISLDTLDPDHYRQVTRNGEISRVLAGIDAARIAGFTGSKINMVLIPGFNDHEVAAMKDFCRRNGLQLQRIHHYSLHDLRTARSGLEAERPLSCSICNRLRLTADGKLKPCLFSDLEFPVDFSDIRSSLERAVQAKPQHGIACATRQNWQIGG
ncbi:MAG: radical SAM protein [Acidobacteria bacterium]|jgi:cyclic pyranopterin phosphate synthase|nr:radical SAM protein [Acidobacteriota bacterium]